MPRKTKKADDTAIATKVLKSVLAKTVVKPNNKLANEIVNDMVGGDFDLIVSAAKAKKEIVTKVMITYDESKVTLSSRFDFTPYDREVHDAVITLNVAGNDVITPEMVYRAMNGMTDTEYVSPQAVEAVSQSLDQSMRIMVKIDYTQEADAYGKKDAKVKYKYEGHLLACEKITVEAGGHKKEAYHLHRSPILYEYAQISGQIISVPIELLNTKDVVRGSEDVSVLKGYLLRQIEGMKSGSFKRSRNILYAGLYKELGMNDLPPKALADKALKIRKHVEAVLKEWVEQEYIMGYSQYKDGKTIKGVTIALDIIDV